MMPGQSAREKKQIQNTADYEQSFLVVHRAIKKIWMKKNLILVYHLLTEFWSIANHIFAFWAEHRNQTLWLSL